MVDVSELVKASMESLKSPGKGNPLPKAGGNGPFIYVFRHGETEDNLNRVFSGWRQSPLTERGIAQAEELAEKMKDLRIDVAMHSPLIRSRDTLMVVLKHHPNAKVEEDWRIIERNYGKLMGMSKSLMMERDPERTALYRRGYDYPPPGGESLKMVEDRVFPFCREIEERAREYGISIAVSAHGNSMRAIRRYFEGLSLEEMLTLENPLASDYAAYKV